MEMGYERTFHIIFGALNAVRGQIATLQLPEALRRIEEVPIPPHVRHGLQGLKGEDIARRGLAVPLAPFACGMVSGRAWRAVVIGPLAYALIVKGLGVGADPIVRVDGAGDGGHHVLLARKQHAVHQRVVVL